MSRELEKNALVLRKKNSAGQLECFMFKKGHERHLEMHHVDSDEHVYRVTFEDEHNRHGEVHHYDRCGNVKYVTFDEGHPEQRRVRHVDSEGNVQFVTFEEGHDRKGEVHHAGRDGRLERITFESGHRRHHEVHHVDSDGRMGRITFEKGHPTYHREVHHADIDGRLERITFEVDHEHYGDVWHVDTGGMPMHKTFEEWHDRYGEVHHPGLEGSPNIVTFEKWHDKYYQQKCANFVNEMCVMVKEMQLEEVKPTWHSCSRSESKEQYIDSAGRVGSFGACSLHGDVHPSFHREVHHTSPDGRVERVMFEEGHTQYGEVWHIGSKGELLRVTFEAVHGLYGEVHHVGAASGQESVTYEEWHEKYYQQPGVVKPSVCGLQPLAVIQQAFPVGVEDRLASMCADHRSAAAQREEDEEMTTHLKGPVNKGTHAVGRSTSGSTGSAGTALQPLAVIQQAFPVGVEDRLASMCAVHRSAAAQRKEDEEEEEEEEAKEKGADTLSQSLLYGTHMGHAN